MLVASNRSLADFNLTKEPEIISCKERLCEMYEDAEKLYKSVKEKVNTIGKYIKKYRLNMASMPTKINLTH